MIKLIDVYSGNDRTDFQQLVSEGYTGIIFKAGQGGWADVPRYKPDWYREAGEAGLLRGWYWLVDSRITLQNHKNELRNWLDPQTLNDELGFWVDVEKPRISMSDNEYRQTPYAGAQHVMNFCGFLTGLGVRPGIYTGPGAYHTVAGGADQATHEYLAQFPLWTAQYPYVYIPYISKPTLFGAWKTWTFWQYREGPDVNIFNGTDDEFYSRFGETTEPPGEPMETKYAGKVILRAKYRPEPNTSNVAYGVLDAGTEVNIDDVIVYEEGKNVWCHIVYPVTGWMASYYPGYPKILDYWETYQPPVEPGVLPDIPVKVVFGDNITYYVQEITATLKPVK